MPEYLAPGVYVEETSFRAKSIEGVSTSTAGFVGPTRFGPLKGTPELVTSFADFQRIYGGLEPMVYGDKEMTNFSAQAVRAFFEEGGSRLYVTRVFDKATDTDEGIAKAELPSPAGDSQKLSLFARYPGRAGNMRVTMAMKLGLNILADKKVNPDDANSATYKALQGANEFDVVYLRAKKGDDGASLAGSDGPAEGFYWLERRFADGRHTFVLVKAGAEVPLDDKLANYEVVIVTVSVATATINERSGKAENENAWADLSLHAGSTKSLYSEFIRYPSSRATELYTPLIIEQTGMDAATVADALAAQTALNKQTLLANIQAGNTSDMGMTFQLMLTGGNDGKRPETAAYAGEEILDGPEKGRKSGFRSLEDVDNISIVAAPGSMYNYNDAAYKPHADAIQRMLIAHCEKMRYRVAILDAAETHLVSEVRAYRAQLDSTYAALYYPWVRAMDPYSGKVINMPPSGFVAGIWARNDTTVGVHKAPANEVVRLAQGFTVMLNKAQQDVLNPEGINCFRFFEGAGYRLWGARTISSDPEWKYINLRRFFCYLEQSIDKNTGWAVFMNNNEPLWANVRQTIEDFLFNEWKSNRLMGSTPEAAYFVRCDRSTMTQNDIDNGRLICLIGVAPVRPAEFVIFRIGQTVAKG